VILADVSEFQDVQWPAFVSGGGEGAIARVFNGYRPDNAWPARQQLMRSAGVPIVGWYFFLVSDVDPASQANSFSQHLGPLAAGEFVAVDSEEVPWHPWAAGQQASSTKTALESLDRQYGQPTMVYTNQDGLNSGVDPTGQPLWIADPSGSFQGAFALRQFTDAYRFPGIATACDASTTNLTRDQFLALVTAHGAVPPHPPAPPPPPPPAPPPAPSADPVLEAVNMWPDTGQGATGPRARIVQALLQAHGYELTADGIFGPNTAAAVRAFQAAKGLGVDGIVGSHTMAALIQP
jgi:hypothetical protein